MSTIPKIFAGALLGAFVLAVSPVSAQDTVSCAQPGILVTQDASGQLKALVAGKGDYDYWKCVESCEFQAEVNCAPHTGLATCADQDKSVFLSGCKTGCQWGEDSCG